MLDHFHVAEGAVCLISFLSYYCWIFDRVFPIILIEGKRLSPTCSRGKWSDLWSGKTSHLCFLGQASMKIRRDTKEQSVRLLVLSYSLYVKLSSTRPRRRSVDVCWPRYHPCRDACPRQRKTRSSGTSTLGWPPKTGWILSDGNEHILIG